MLSYNQNSHEELRAISVLSSVGHRQHERFGMIEGKVFIFKRSTVNGLATLTRARRKVASLYHEVFYDPVKLAALVVQRFASRLAHTCFSSTQLAEILTRLWTYFAEEFDC